MITSVVFFLFISLTTIAGLVSPTVRDYTVSRLDLDSKKAYYLTESGSEDYLYRVFRGHSVEMAEALTVDGNTVTTDLINDPIAGIYIESNGSMTSLKRRVKVDFAYGPTASFSYGLQVGEGGVDLQGGTIVGDVFSNGPITGDNSSAITGTAISASGSAVYEDVSNGTGVPFYDKNFGDTSTTEDIAQSFMVHATGPVNKAQFYLKKFGTPGDATVMIVNNSAGAPGATFLASGTLSSSSVTANYDWVEVVFTSNPTLTAGVPYWVVINSSSANNKRYYIVGASMDWGITAYPDGIGVTGQFGGSWANLWTSAYDHFFKIFLGGPAGSISGTSGQLNIGTVSGTTQANTVNNVDSTGLIYCQSGSGNNQSCTYQDDPTQQSFPIPDDYVTGWKIQAETGGIISGNYTVSSGNVSLGPKKIVGNLDVSGGATLTVTGTLWVTGNISLTGGSHIVLSPSYGSTDGILVSDGNVQIGGGSDASGSGAPNSYVVILTTSSSGSAIDISGGSGAVILYAKDGTLNVTGGATLKSAVADRITVSGGSQLIYETGLAELEFGGGGAAVSQLSIQTWTEIE